MYNLSSGNSSKVVFSMGNSTSRDEEHLLKRKLLLLSKMAIISNEVEDTDKYTLDESLDYLIDTLCHTKKLWLSKEECEKLEKSGNLTKLIRFGDLKDYLLQLELEDTPESGFYIEDIGNLENNYRFFITKDLIKSYSLVNDTVVTINVRH